jgi:hypothetical protein
MAPWLSKLTRVILLALGLTLASLTCGVGSRPSGTADAQAAPPCNNYSSNTAPPINVGVAISYQGGAIQDVIYVDFKSYVRDACPTNGSPAGITPRIRPPRLLSKRSAGITPYIGGEECLLGPENATTSRTIPATKCIAQG